MNVPGSVGLGGGEAEGLVLSHAVSFWCGMFMCFGGSGRNSKGTG